MEAISSALSKVDRKRVKGIGISGQQHGFVPVDVKGEVRSRVPDVVAAVFKFRHCTYINLDKHHCNL